MRRAPAKPPAQPVGMAESDMNKSSWQKPACAHSVHRLGIFKRESASIGPGAVGLDTLMGVLEASGSALYC